MGLELKEIIHIPGGRVPVEANFDLSQLDFYGSYPLQEPVIVSGQVINRAGILLLEAQAETVLHLRCDRCGVPFLETMSLPMNHMLADRLEDSEQDEIILLDGTSLDLEQLVTEDIVLGMDSVHLCRETCRGRCPGCGADLNRDVCRCKPDPDPRWSALSALLEKE